MIIYLLSDITDAKQFEWIVNSEYNKKKFNIKFILINNSFNKNKLAFFLERNNSILAKLKYKNFFSYFTIIIKLFYLFLKFRPKIIHCHLRKASILGITVGFILQIKKRIITRHHGNENHSNIIKGLQLDKLICRLSTNIVSISNNTNNLLIDESKNNKSKINLIHHGFDFRYFNENNLNNLESIRMKYNIDKHKKVIGSISRFVDWKGVQYTIKAFAKYYKEFPNSILILANAKGPFIIEIESLLKCLPNNSYRIIEFETDIKSLYKLFDIFIHVPVDSYCEAFGQVYIESLAYKIPSIFTKSGIGSEFLKHKTNCYIANYKNFSSIYNGLIFFSNISKDDKYKIIEEGYSDVNKKFSINKMLSKLNFLYYNE